MANTPTISKTDGAVKLVRDDHRHILDLFQLYRATPADSRQSYVEQILQRLADHFKMEERLTEDVLHQGDDGRLLVEQLLVEHEEIKAMIDELQQAENDDDESLDEFFEDMMQTVRAHFIAEERIFFRYWTRDSITPIGSSTSGGSFSRRQATVTGCPVTPSVAISLSAVMVFLPQRQLRSIHDRECQGGTIGWPPYLEQE